MKHLFKPSILFFMGVLMTILFSSCEEEQFEIIENNATQESNTNGLITASKVTTEAIPEVYEYINTITKGTFAFDLNGDTIMASPKATTNTSVGALVLDSVIQVIDGEYHTYTFRIKTNKWNIFNLVITEHPKGLSHFFIEYRGAMVTNHQTGVQRFSGKMLTYDRLGQFSNIIEINKGVVKNGFGGSGDCPPPLGDPNNGGGHGGSGGGGPGNYAGTPAGDYGGTFSFNNGISEGGSTDTVDTPESPSEDDCGQDPLVISFLDCGDRSQSGINNSEDIILVDLASAFKNSRCSDGDGVIGGDVDNAAYNVLVYDLERLAGLTRSQRSFLITNVSPSFVFNSIDYLDDKGYSSFAKSFIRTAVQGLKSEGHASITLQLIIDGSIPFNDEIVDFLNKNRYSSTGVQVADAIVQAERNNEITRSQAGDIINFLRANATSDEAIIASNLTIGVLKANRLNGPYDQTYFNILNPHFDVNTHDPFFAARLATQIAIVTWQHKNDNWSDTRIFATALWQVLKEPVHLLLDVGGLIPVVGEAADLVNGAIYLLEGDQLNAGLSFAGAVPFAGWAATGTKLVGKVVITAGGVKAIQVIARNTDAIAAIANKLKNKVTIVTQRGVTLLKDKLGNVIARGNTDTARVLGNLADTVNDTQRNVISQWKDNIASQSNKRKGNFGEMATDLDLAEQGYIPLHTRIDNIDAPGHNGIDAVMEKDGQYFIIESKFSSTSTPSLNAATSTLPKQMSRAWIERPGILADAISDTDLADDIIDAGYTRVLATHGPNDDIIYKLVDINGKIGNIWTPN